MQPHMVKLAALHATCHQMQIRIPGLKNQPCLAKIATLCCHNSHIIFASKTKITSGVHKFIVDGYN